MKKYILPFIAVALMLFLGACSNEELPVIEEQEEDYVISVTASMPDNEIPETRLSLVDNTEKKFVNVEWKAGDKIRVVIVQNGKPFPVSDTNPISITPDSNKKKGIFNIELKGWWWTSGFKNNEPFTIYGVYGASAIDAINLTTTLPNNHQTTTEGTLEGLGEQHEVMLYFSYEHPGINNLGSTVDDLGISVKFKHTGSLFRINIKNEGEPDIHTYGEVRLIGKGTNDKWAYNSESKFSLVEGGKFVKTTAKNEMIIYTPTQGYSIPKGSTMTVWRWHAIDGSEWPELQLQLTNGNNVRATSGTKYKRSRTLKRGQVYEINASVNGDKITFP